MPRWGTRTDTLAEIEVNIAGRLPKSVLITRLQVGDISRFQPRNEIKDCEVGLRNVCREVIEAYLELIYVQIRVAEFSDDARPS